MKKVLKSAILSTAVVSAVGITLSSCGGGSSSSSTSSTPVASLEKSAVITVSYPTSNSLSSQLLSDDTGAIRVDIYQPKLDADGDIDCKEGCFMNKASVTVTAQNPTATVNLYPTFSIICVSQLANANSSPLSTMCSYANLKAGQNDIKYTLIRGTWSLPTGKDIGGYTSFAIGSFKYYGYYYGTGYKNDNIFTPMASKDGTNWESPNILGLYLLEKNVSTNSADILAFGIEKTVNNNEVYDGFVALNGSGNTMEKMFLNGYYYAPGVYKLLKYKETVKITISGKNGNDITNDVLQTCKFNSTDGKTIEGCLMKGLTQGTDQDYNFKVDIERKISAKDLCRDDGLLYDDAQGVCYGTNYYYSNGNYYCYNGMTYNNNNKRCERSVKDFCEKSYEGTYDTTQKVCTEKDTYYVKGSYEKVTLTGKNSLPAKGSISAQSK